MYARAGVSFVAELANKIGLSPETYNANGTAQLCIRDVIGTVSEGMTADDLRDPKIGEAWQVSPRIRSNSTTG